MDVIKADWCILTRVLHFDADIVLLERLFTTRTYFACFGFFSQAAAICSTKRKKETGGKKSLIKVKLTSVVVCWLKAAAAANIVLCANSVINTHQGSCEWITAPLTAEEAQQQVVNKSYSLRLDLTGFGTYNALLELF